MSKRGLGKISAIIITLVIIAAIGGALAYYYSIQRPQQQTSLPTTTSPTSTQTQQTLPITTEPVTIGTVAIRTNVEFSPLAVIFGPLFPVLKKYDPNINIQEFTRGSGELINAVVSGQVQIGIGSTDSVINAISKGLPLIIVAAFRDSPYERLVVVKADSNIYNISQLNGTTFTATAVGSFSDISVKYLINKFNLNVKIIYGFSEDGQMAAILTGQATAATINPFTSWALIKNGSIRVIYNFTVGPWHSTVIFTTKSYAEKHPEVIRAVLLGLFEAINIYYQNKNDSINYLNNYYKGLLDPSVINYMYNSIKLSRDGTINATALQIAINTLLQLRIITNSTLTAKDLYTDKFVKIVY